MATKLSKSLNKHIQLKERNSLVKEGRTNDGSCLIAFVLVKFERPRISNFIPQLKFKLIIFKIIFQPPLVYT